MAATRAPSLLQAIRFEATDSGDWIPPRRNHIRPKPLLSFSKPSWIVRTESNVWREQKKKPDPPCEGCSGTGRVECPHCCGRGQHTELVRKGAAFCSPSTKGGGFRRIVSIQILGRTNYVHLAMLPKGKWPKWCRSCGGSGLDYCSRCFGAGGKRYALGFRFMKRESNDTQDPSKYKIGDKSGPQTAADSRINGE